MQIGKARGIKTAKRIAKYEVEIHTNSYKKICIESQIDSVSRWLVRQKDSFVDKYTVNIHTHINKR